MFPNRPIYVYFLFPVKAKYLVIFFAAIEILASFRHTSDGIGHFAHLGGMVIGYLYIKSDFRIPSFFRLSTYLTRLRNLKHQRRMKAVNKQRDREHQLMDRVDQILDKINQVGYDNLTREDKKTLEQASQVLSKEREKR